MTFFHRWAYDIKYILDMGRKSLILSLWIVKPLIYIDIFVWSKSDQFNIMPY